MNIEMLEFTPDYVIPESGKYLVRTTSTFLKSQQYLQARCRRNFDEKKGAFYTSVDVSNQRVTHISKEPLNFK